jgi:pyruvate/2-oxoglutarate dehydrogenase complex dihydrolipoamide dehydrogenase (E3) component
VGELLSLALIPLMGICLLFLNHRIVDTDHLSGLCRIPKEIIVVGAGVVGLEYASFMAALGADVTLIDQRPIALEFVDKEITKRSSTICASSESLSAWEKKWRKLGLT